ncbi:nucleoside hydrolase [Sulfurisphaera ohwakuensis]|uniref:Nucleoside hydrolase n=1 Tax=Sulfurisphaera ohwakuensis TaxID=69656 RepID=A0A650CIZ4_SULOH|nr:nucleoside hydrolase [Sulfurisphaera ohwakuensis]MBB5253434.1 purine nucleosidase [Sulfurisphaera ohwakuensis]QGR17749.1 nucleoside hydrolase [Sulfurisphaera ohwakuensis]
MRKAIFDTDTASDDAIALMLALDYFEVLGVTIVAGNVKFENEVSNALFTLEYLNKPDIPVYLGAQRPLLGQWRTVEEVHGKNGFGDWEYPSPLKKPENEFAADAIIRLSKEYEGELEILAVSPLTNIALAYLKDSRIINRIRKIWIMGGAFTRGNTTEIAEFNFWVDPEAAQIVLNAGFDITIVPWEIAEESATITDEEWNKIEDINTKRSEFFLKVNRVLREYSKSVGSRGSVHPDSLTVTIAYDNSVAIEKVSKYVNVELCSRSRGAMLIDWYGLNKRRPNAEVVIKADSQKFKKYLFDSLSKA